MIERLLDSDPERARAHADHIVARAGRVAAVREARGLVAYHEGDWKVALNEFRTARRLSGSHHLLPYLVDIERALGRPERALELSASPESLTLDAASRIELDIVISGVRRDMGDLDAALLQLRGPELDPTRRKPWSGRLFYAYADTLLAKGLEEEARDWFAVAIEADPSLDTDAAERVDELDGTVFLDLGEDDEEPEAQEVTDAAEAGADVESVTPQASAPVDEPEAGETAEIEAAPDEVPGVPEQAQAAQQPEEDEEAEAAQHSAEAEQPSVQAADGDGPDAGSSTPREAGEIASEGASKTTSAEPSESTPREASDSPSEEPSDGPSEEPSETAFDEPEEKP